MVDTYNLNGYFEGGWHTEIASRTALQYLAYIGAQCLLTSTRLAMAQVLSCDSLTCMINSALSSVCILETNFGNPNKNHARTPD